MSWDFAWTALHRSGVSAMPRCPPQGVENEEPNDCSYGVTTDYCGRKVCAKVSTRNHCVMQCYHFVNFSVA